MFFSILFFILIFIMFFGIFLYPKITYSIKKKIPNKIKNLPEVTILIPAYNEEKLIANKIKNTLSIDYPQKKMEIVVIDNGSTDNTSRIVKRFPVTLLKCEKGKIRALNKGIEYAKTDLIVMTDADVDIDKKAIRSMVSYLTGDIGAVGGYVVPKSKSFIKDKEIYKNEDWKLRYEESLIDSVCNLDGKLTAFRKFILPKFPEDSLTDDYSMTFLIRKKGYRSLIDKSAKVYEVLPDNLSDEIKQFKRYATDVFITNLKNINFLFNYKYGYFGMMTFPFRRFFPLFYPMFIMYILIYLYFINPYISLFLLVGGFFILLFFKRLILIQITAVMLSYFSLFKNKSLTGGKWEKPRA